MKIDVTTRRIWSKTCIGSLCFKIGVNLEALDGYEYRDITARKSFGLWIGLPTAVSCFLIGLCIAASCLYDEALYMGAQV
jgi:hypothetical protein